MKKIILTVLAVATLALTLCSCAKCDICDESVPFFSAKTEEVFGEEVCVCNDCLEDLEDLTSLGGLLG